MDSRLLDDVFPAMLLDPEEAELTELLEEGGLEADTVASRTEQRGGKPPGVGADDGLATGLYSAAMREKPLLSREEEAALGRTIRESRLQMTQALAAVPLAIRHFLAVLEQVKAGARPATDALFAPFDVASGEVEDDGASRRSRAGWMRAAHALERTHRGWSDRAQGIRYRRLREQFAHMQPSVVVLGEALAACRALDARVRRIERATATYHADIPGLADDSAGEPGLAAGLTPERAELEAIALEAGTDLTTLREACVVAAAAHSHYRQAQRRMVEGNIRLAHFMAHKLKGHGVDFEDLVQDAMLGLMRAADKFDYRLGYKFSTYACQWIWQSITRSLADGSRTIRVAAHMHDTVVVLRKHSRALQQRLGRDPTTAELAEASGLEEDKIRRALHAARRPLSLDAPLAELDDATLHTCIPDAAGERSTALAHDARLTVKIEAVLTELPPREAFIVRLRHGFGGTHSHTLEEIGKLLGITRERARQIESRAMSKLREAFEPGLLEGLGD